MREKNTFKEKEQQRQKVMIDIASKLLQIKVDSKAKRRKSVPRARGAREETVVTIKVTVASMY